MARAVVLAGGRGTRLAPFTTVLPKPLLPLDDVPILEIILRQLARAGYTDVTLAIGHLGQLLEAYFGDGSRVGVRLQYAREDSPLGTAGPLKAIDGLDGPFLVMNGDVLCTLDYRDFLAAHIASGATLSVSTHVRSNVVDFGVLRTDGEERVVAYDEKPATELLVSMGVYAFSPAALDHIELGERLDFPELVIRLLQSGEYVRSARFAGFWLDIGRHDDFARAQEEFVLRRSEFLGESD